MTAQNAVFEENKWIEDLQKGDPEAWKRLWNKEAWKIIASARRRGLDEARARDICLTVFEELVSRLRSSLSLPEGGLHFYILKIARYEINNFLRSREQEVLLSTDDLVADSLLMDIVASPGPDPEEQLLQREEREEKVKAISKALEELAPAEHQVITFLLKGHTESEIAKLLERSEKAVRNLRYRALYRLAEVLREQYGTNTR